MDGVINRSIVVEKNNKYFNWYLKEIFIWDIEKIQMKQLLWDRKITSKINQYFNKKYKYLIY